MTSSRQYSVGEGIGWVEGGDVWGRALIYVAPLPNGPVSVLPDQAAAVWLCVVGGAGDLVDEVAALTDNDPDAIRDDVLAFVDKLVRRGLIVDAGRRDARSPQ